LSQAINEAEAIIADHTAKVTLLKTKIMEVRAENALLPARFESIAIRTAADVTGALSRRKVNV
jgi:hypothetical protein